MHKRKLLKIVSRFLIPWMFWISLIVSLAVGAALRVEPEYLSNTPELYENIINWSKNQAFYLLPLTTVLVAICSAARSRIEPSAFEAAIKGLLDDFREAAFPSDDADIDHRVTLFKYKYFCWSNLFHLRCPLGGWLVPYERSGHFTLKSSARFHVPMDRPEKAEGFAGRVFTTGNCEYISNLPDLIRTSSDSNKQRYAKLTNVTEKFVNEKLLRNGTFPRSLWGIHVEVNGRRWGVIIIDSKHSTLSGREELKAHYRHIGVCLNNLLK